jgi:ribosomal protein S18 acetylase RimI-like enzyme
MKYLWGMTGSYTISKATQEDIPSIVTLVNGAYRGEGSKAGWTTEADLLGGVRVDEKSVDQMIKEPDSVILLYTDPAGNTDGCIYLRSEGPHIYLGMLTVSPQSQAKGIGKILLKVSEEYALGKGSKGILMTVISLRHELIAWYERHGYYNTGEKKPFPNDPSFGIPKQELEFIVLKKDML